MSEKKQSNESLTQAQRFGLALGSVLTSQNSGRHTTLYPHESTPEQVAMEKKTLARDWGIHCRDDLIQTLERLASGDGHNNEFVYLRTLLATLDNDSRHAFIDSFKKDVKQYAKLKIVERYLYGFQKGGIYAYDGGRYIMLCRWAAMTGLLQNGEAWRLILDMAINIQSIFSDWYAYGASYVAGRHFWYSNLSAIHVHGLMQHVKQLFAEKNGPWTIPWNTDLIMGYVENDHG